MIRRFIACSFGGVAVSTAALLTLLILAAILGGIDFVIRRTR